VAWTAAALGPEERAYLAALPCVHRAGDVLLVHASPFEPERWHYIHGLPDAADHFASFTERLCFVGHSHRPGCYALAEGGGVVRGGARERLEPGRRYLVNVGSVGQPRDRDPRAAFAILDDRAGTVELHRAPYDVAGTQARMRALGLPAFLVERLASGV
jgi:diadenosine tetraphosphatase ApaH/serine/threonine PP2A family protein phosphatase